MSNLTEKQKGVLVELTKGSAAIPIIHFGKLREMGYVAKADIGAARGYIGASITDAGKAAVV